MFLPEVGKTLNNRGIIYRSTKRVKEAEVDYTEALRINRDLLEVNPTGHANEFARSIVGLTVTFQISGDSRACSIVSENLPNGVSAEIRERVRILQREVC